MKQAVEQAIEEIRKAFVGHRVDVESDDDGGAFVKVHDLDLGEKLDPSSSWVAFQITFQYPFADVYPHYCVPELKRRDGPTLNEAFRQSEWKTPTKKESATSISRRSNRWDAAADTAAIKLAKVLAWIQSQ